MTEDNENRQKGRVDKAHYANMPLKKQQEWSRQIVDRIMKAYQFNEKKVLAKYLGCHQNMPSNWIQTASVPWTTVHLCHTETGASLDWLYYGKEPRYNFNESEEERCKSLINQAMIFGRRLLQSEINEREAFQMVGDTLIKDLRCYFTSGTDALSAQDEPHKFQQKQLEQT